MLIEVRHHTAYAYSGPVRLECQTLRFRPRSDGTQHLRAFDLEIDPAPTTRAEGVDADGNAVTQVWHESPTDRFELTARALVETTQTNPFGYLLPPEATRIPFAYPPARREAMLPFLPASEAHADLRAFADEIVKETNGETIAFLGALSRRVFEAHKPLKRHEGAPWPAHETLARREGACRDLTVLFMEACRAQGIAARFVSGYHLRREDERGDELHAWAEAYLPGIGWRGYDPSIGEAVADRHVAVAAAAEPEGAAPVHGTYRASGVTARLVARVDVTPAKGTLEDGR